MTDAASMVTAFSTLTVAIGTLLISVGVLMLVVKLGSAIEGMTKKD